MFEVPSDKLTKVLLIIIVILIISIIAVMMYMNHNNEQISDELSDSINQKMDLIITHLIFKVLRI